MCEHCNCDVPGHHYYDCVTLTFVTDEQLEALLS
jgi:hypothetical protein